MKNNIERAIKYLQSPEGEIELQKKLQEAKEATKGIIEGYRFKYHQGRKRVSYGI